jgi:hypothetical protein
MSCSGATSPDRPPSLAQRRGGSPCRPSGSPLRRPWFGVGQSLDPRAGAWPSPRRRNSSHGRDLTSLGPSCVPLPAAGDPDRRPGLGARRERGHACGGYSTSRSSFSIEATLVRSSAPTGLIGSAGHGRRQHPCHPDARPAHQVPGTGCLLVLAGMNLITRAVLHQRPPAPSDTLICRCPRGHATLPPLCARRSTARQRCTRLSSAMLVVRGQPRTLHGTRSCAISSTRSGGAVRMMERAMDVAVALGRGRLPRSRDQDELSAEMAALNDASRSPW